MNKSRVQATALVLLALAVCAQGSEARVPPGNYDALSEVSATGSVSPLARSPKWVVPGQPLHADLRFGVPTFVWAAPRAVPEGRSAADRARDYLRQYAPLYGLSPSDADAAVLDAVHDTGRGAIITRFSERVDGIEVFREEIKLAQMRDGRLLAISGYLSGAPRLLARNRPAFALAPEQAVAVALGEWSDALLAAADVRATGEIKGPYSAYALSARASSRAGFAAVQPVHLKKVYFHLPGRFVPAYLLVVDVASREAPDSMSYLHVVSAADGRVLFRHDLTSSDSYTYKVWADTTTLWPQDGPQGDVGSPHPTGLPDSFQAPFIDQSDVSLQNFPFETNDPWLPPDANQTTGNNVEAYADISGVNGFDANDVRGMTTGAGVFGNVNDPNLLPNESNTQIQGAVTHLFYVNNFLHDWFYDGGFDEASANAQIDNFGRGGSGGDSLMVEAQDSADTNNANMSTPPDGLRPRMQMFRWVGAPGVLEITAPGSIDGFYPTGGTVFGTAPFDLTDDVVLVIDTTPPTSDGCEPGFVNAGDVANKIALIDRGLCTFASKVTNALAAGATGVIIANNIVGGPYITLGGTPVNLPALGTDHTTGQIIRSELANGVVARLAKPADLQRDGTIDTQIVAHEWGHYLSNRLVGNSAGLSTNQARSMGEGWSDFVSMLLTVGEDDTMTTGNETFQGVYGIATHSLRVLTEDNFYFGIRRYPYSTDLTKNPLTFRHIANENPLPFGSGVPNAPADPNNAEVHNAGEIWTTMLWECYAGILRDTLGGTPRLSFDEGRERMRDALVAGLKLTPMAPTFTEARDALLAGMFAQDPNDFFSCSPGFASRGAGVLAVSPPRDSITHNGVVENMLSGGLPVFVEATLDDSVAPIDSDDVLDSGETGLLAVELTNSGWARLEFTEGSVTSTTSGVSFPNGNALDFAGIDPFQNGMASVQVSLQGTCGIGAAAFDITFNDPMGADPNSQMETVGFRVNTDELPGQSTSDDVEADSPAWTLGSNPGLSQASPWRREAESPLSHFWRGPDAGSLSDQFLISPALQVAAVGDFSFTFRHRFQFEFDASEDYDGGVLEMSTDGGTVWNDIGASVTSGSYNGVISACCNNPLANRQAWVGQSPGYPAFQNVTVNLGASVAGQTVMIRFRVAADEAVADIGWDVDDIAFSGITNQPFPILVADPPCPTSTPTSTATATVTLTPTATPTRTATPSATQTQPAVPTATRTQTGVPISTATPTPTTTPPVSLGIRSEPAWTAALLALLLSGLLLVRKPRGFRG